MFHKDQQVGDYTLIKQLGKGSFGEVWLAHNQTGHPSPVAIKFPKSEDIDWQAIVQEIGLWVLCGRHPNVLPFIEARNYNGQIAIISEYAPDGSLRNLLKERGALSHGQAVDMIIGVLDGLAQLHSSGIIHRDLKPENVLLQGNTPRLADFGISRVMTANSMSQTASGTPYYMAPEAFEYRRNEQTDVWSIGVILYELLKGSLPFPQRDLPALYGAIKEREPEPLSVSIPSGLREIVSNALEKQPEARYRTATEMRQALYHYWQLTYGKETISTIDQTISFVEPVTDLVDAGGIIALYNRAVIDPPARGVFREEYQPIRIGTFNAAARRQNPTIHAEFREMKDGDFFALLSNGNEYLAFPRLGLTIDAVVYSAVAFGYVFETLGYDPKLYYSRYRVVQPAIFRPKGECWELMARGKLDLGLGTEDF